MINTPAPTPERYPDPPGSPEACTRGCECPRMDNHFGRGRGGRGELYGWIVVGNCTLHTRADALPLDERST